MSNRKITDEQARAAYEEWGSYRAASRALGVCPETVWVRLLPLQERVAHYDQRRARHVQNQAVYYAHKRLTRMNNESVRAANNAYNRAWCAANPERARRHHREAYARLRADPMRYAAYLALQCSAQRARRAAAKAGAV